METYYSHCVHGVNQVFFISGQVGRGGGSIINCMSLKGEGEGQYPEA